MTLNDIDVTIAQAEQLKVQGEEISEGRPCDDFLGFMQTSHLLIFWGQVGAGHGFGAKM